MFDFVRQIVVDSGLSFAVYLIHDNPISAEPLGKRWFRSTKMIRTLEIALMNEHRYTITAIVFCVVVDAYRQKLC
jgi:hypothetical protein